MARIYQHTDFLVISSFREGLPYTLLEGMSARIPVLATAVGDIPVLIKNDVTGILISPGNENDLERGMEELLTDPEKCERLAENAYNFVTERFSQDKMTKKTEDLYLSFIN